MTEVYFVQKKEGVTPGLLRYSNSLADALRGSVDLRIAQNVYLGTEGRISKILKRVGIKIPRVIMELFMEVMPTPSPSGIVHFSDHTISSSLFWRRYKRSVVTIHDVIDFTKYNLFGELRFGFIDKFIRRLIIEMGARKADKIIALSEHTKREVVRYLKVPEAKVEVIYPSFDSEFRPMNYERDPNRILYVGSEEPRKNFLTLIRAFAKLKPKLPGVKLIKGGRSGWDKGRRDIESEISSLGLKEDVIFKEHVEDIISEYCKASLFVQPSLYEGFGVTVLEAMACGTPVICSNVPPLPELVGDAAVLVDPMDIGGLADAMHTVLINKKKKEELVRRGFERTKLFSWEKTAQQTVRLYEKLIKE